MEWSIQNKVISEINYKGKNIINPWGIETADSSAFFSLEDGYGYLYNIISEEYEIDSNTYRYLINNKMVEGQWEIEGEDSLSSNTIQRKISLKCKEDSFFMDFVMRFRIKKEFAYAAIINEKILLHNASNTYYQYDVDTVTLLGEEFNIVITAEKFLNNKFMKNVMYVRDAKDEWVVHIRYLPKVWNKEVIKLCNSWYNTQAIPVSLSNRILSNKRIREYLWYHNERKPYKSIVMKLINPNAIPMTKLQKGTKLNIESRFEITENKDTHISIIIPTYKRVDRLRKLLDSICNQTYKNFEVIIIDDNSPNLDSYKVLVDEYMEKLDDLKFLVNENNMGAPYSRNRGIMESKYNLLALVDDDDEWEPLKLEKQMAAFNKTEKSEIGIIYTWTTIKNGVDKIAEYKKTVEDNVLDELMQDNFIPSPSVLVTKKAIIEAGLFDESLPSCQDWDMWIRILKLGYKVNVVQDFLTIYNKHNLGSIGTSPKAKLGYRMFYRKHHKLYIKNYFKRMDLLGLIKFFKRMVW